jgi:hypothetical protein
MKLKVSPLKTFQALTSLVFKGNIVCSICMIWNYGIYIFQHHHIFYKYFEFIVYRSSGDASCSEDVETIILETVKSAVRFQRHVGDALIKVCLSLFILYYKNILFWFIKKSFSPWLNIFTLALGHKAAIWTFVKM